MPGRLARGALGRRARRSRAWEAVAAAAGVGVLLTACQALPGAGSASGPPPAMVTIRAGNLVFTGAGPAGRAGGGRPSGVPVDTSPGRGIQVAVSGGTLTAVTVTTRGRTVAGGRSAAGGVWSTRWALAPAQGYRVVVRERTREGAEVVAESGFRTLRPRRTVTASTWLAAGHVYGVGMPIMISFSRGVADRAAVERSLEIWSSRPVTGAWYWLTSREVWFRPRRYWPAGARVRFVAHLAGVEVAPGVYGAADLSQRFRIGKSLIAVANAATHHMRVWYQGRLVGDWPVSTGKPGLDTPDGRYLSFAMGNPVDMNSATFGVRRGQPGYYNLMVYDSVQFTFDGDYVHSAPWSVAEQGYANVSHGCVNVAPADAAWYYRRSLIGDPISVVGSPRRGVWGDGWTIWFLSWRELLKGSATGLAALVDSAGSRLVPRS